MKKGGRWLLGLYDGLFLSGAPKTSVLMGAHLGDRLAVSSLHFIFLFSVEWRGG